MSAGLSWILILISLYLMQIPHDGLDRLRNERKQKLLQKERVERRLSETAEREKSILGDLERLDRSLRRMEGDLAFYRRKVSRTERRIKELTENIARLSREERAMRAKAAERLRAMYKFGYNGLDRGYISLLLASNSTSELLSRAKYISTIAKADREMLMRLKSRIEQLRRQREELKREKEKLERAKSTVERKRREIARARSERRRLLERYRAERQIYENTIAQLEENIKRLDSLIEGLSRGERPMTDLVQLSLKDLGRLPWPVSGDIIPNPTKELKGVTIKAPQGAEVISIYDGVVEYARWFDGLGLGLMVIINHGHGYRSLYAHLSDIAVSEGERVRRGQVIGKVGDTGSLVGPALYFEIRRGLIPMDIRRWMR
ncbi:peptidoglycan DD-metalloendopeptidase family protein [Candidatus Poribacteria bacterium]|nr:peptidoglycan DD-metalloendopeptidase family protein [Candidatus Poribacteria bacterium]